MSKITLQNDKLKKLLTEKAELITLGRAKSEEIEKLETEMQEMDKQMKALEKEVSIEEFKAKIEELNTKVEPFILQLKEIEEQIKAKKTAVIPKELGEKYDIAKIKKDELENERNKIALKAMKYSGKIIPLAQKLMKPYLEDEYSDFDTIKIEDDEIIASTFSHMDDFITNFKKKQNGNNV